MQLPEVPDAVALLHCSHEGRNMSLAITATVLPAVKVVISLQRGKTFCAEELPLKHMSLFDKLCFCCWFVELHVLEAVPVQAQTAKKEDHHAASASSK